MPPVAGVGRHVLLVCCPACLLASSCGGYYSVYTLFCTVIFITSTIIITRFIPIKFMYITV